MESVGASLRADSHAVFMASGLGPGRDTLLGLTRILGIIQLNSASFGQLGVNPLNGGGKLVRALRFDNGQSLTLLGRRIGQDSVIAALAVAISSS